jgi:Tol biopolymer transport system component
MTVPHRFVAFAAAAILVAGIGGCTASPKPTPSAATGTGGLPALNLANVRTETAAARGSTIGAAGGTISATGANGAVYTLVLPAGAVGGDTAIALYPVTSLVTLPKGASVKAGVQLSPDGLRLRAPATLTIGLPAGTDAGKQGALAWAGDAVDVHRYPSITTGRSVVMTIVHFSGYADTELFNEEVKATAANAHLEDLLLLHWQLRENKSELRDDLRSWYRDVVKPALINGGLASLGEPLDVSESDTADAEYTTWLEALYWARQVTGDSAFTVAPELAESVGIAGPMLHSWYVAENGECLKRADDVDPAGALSWAELAIYAYARASMYTALSGIDFATVATVENRLDLPSLLDGLCVKVVIDPDRSYSAKKSGESGTVTLRAGFQIGDRPVRYGVPAHAVWVELKVKSGADIPAFPLGDDGKGSVDGIVWPAGSDPLQIDIVATLTAIKTNVVQRTYITGSDRITSGLRGIAFRSDRGGGPVPQIWVMDADGKNANPVTNDLAGQASLVPAWSPDGSKIAFSASRTGGNPQIWVMDADGDHAHQLTHFDAPSQWPTWSPDGLRIAFSSYNGDGEGRSRIFIIDATGANETPLTAPESGGGDLAPRWSPDGTRIVFTAVHRQGINGQQIYVVDLRNPTVVTALTSGGESTNATNPSWSPDGTQIVFLQRGAISIMNADGTDARPIFTVRPGSIPRPVWSPDGALIAFSMPWTNDTSKQGIFTIDINGENLKALSPPSANETDPDWRR